MNNCVQEWAESSFPQYASDDGDDPVGFILKDGEYEASCDDQGDIFITKSPYFTWCRLCSPCAPGAGDIMSQDPQGEAAYCFGHDWFESGVAPYKVFRVADHKK